MGRLIDIDEVVKALGDAHFKNWGDAAVVVGDIPEVPAITLEWIGEYFAWLQNIGGAFALSDANAIKSMLKKWEMEQRHFGCGHGENEYSIDKGKADQNEGS